MNLMDYYKPEFFNAKTMDEARNIVLMWHEMSSEERWQPETEWTKDLLIAMRTFDENSIVLDFGTGVGRLAKMLIETFQCKVVGVDISEDMLKFAKEYVNNDKFETMTADEFIEKRYTEHFTHAISVWALQHSPVSQYDIARIQQAIKEDGNIFIIETREKCIPERADIAGNYFYNDKVDNKAELTKWFYPLAMGTIPVSISTRGISDISWWGFLQKNKKAA